MYPVLCVLTALALSIPCACAAGAQFSDVTSGPLGDTAGGIGAAWGDYDGDGDLDLYVGSDGPNKLLRNDLGVWVDATVGPLGDDGDGRGTVWGDYDNDGDLDLYHVKAGPNLLVRNDAGTWVDVTSGPLGDAGAATCAAWGDYDNDGDLDLYVTNVAANVLLRNDGAIWVDATSGPLGDTGSGRGATWGDYDNDGDLDLYLANFDAANRLFRNDGGSWVDVTSGPLGDTAPGEGVAWGDYDNDGDLDLYLANRDAANKLFRNDGDAWVDATSGPLGDEGMGIGVAWADYDNDGDLDLYLTNGIGEANRLFRNDAGSWVDATTAPLGDTGRGTGAAWGDYDGDGDLDLYVVNNFGANKLFRNENDTGNHWLHVKLEGVTSNRSGIGARVRVVAGGVSLMEEVSGGSGFGTQNSLVAEFGLGSTTTVDSLIVEWPSGITQVVNPGPGTDQVVTVVEDDIVPTGQPVDPVGVRPGACWLGNAHPNPFNPLTTLSFALPRRSYVCVSIYDIAGRRVRTLVSREMAAAAHRVSWDGKDSRGRAVASGVYICRMRTGAFSQTRSVVLSR